MPSPSFALRRHAFAVLWAATALCAGAIPISQSPPAGGWPGGDAATADIGTIDCQVRQLAWDFARSTLNGTCLPMQRVYDALLLHDCPLAQGGGGGGGEKENAFSVHEFYSHGNSDGAPCREAQDWKALVDLHAQHAQNYRRGGVRVGIHYFIVDPDGLGKPGGEGGGRAGWWRIFQAKDPPVYDSLDEALTASRAVSQGGKKVLLLRRGLYLLGHRGVLKLGRQDSNTYLLAFPGEAPVLSGGVRVSPHWFPRRCPGGGGGGGGGGVKCWRAQIRSQLPGKDESPDFTFNQLFLPNTDTDTDTDKDAPSRFSKRAIRARHPNGNPETSGLHTNPSGYMPADTARWLPEIDTPPAREVHIPGVRSGSLFPDFQVWVGGAAACVCVYVMCVCVCIYIYIYIYIYI
jgi:hypothetical protein